MVYLSTQKRRYYRGQGHGLDKRENQKYKTSQKIKIQEFFIVKKKDI